MYILTPCYYYRRVVILAFSDFFSILRVLILTIHTEFDIQHNYDADIIIIINADKIRARV